MSFETFLTANYNEFSVNRIYLIALFSKKIRLFMYFYLNTGIPCCKWIKKAKKRANRRLVFHKFSTFLKAATSHLHTKYKRLRVHRLKLWLSPQN